MTVIVLIMALNPCLSIRSFPFLPRLIVVHKKINSFDPLSTDININERSVDLKITAKNFDLDWVYQHRMLGNYNFLFKTFFFFFFHLNFYFIFKKKGNPNDAIILLNKW